ncbi:MAG TPA: DUF1572 family protein [Bacteroidia bacterium]|jgi:hypothetical protein
MTATLFLEIFERDIKKLKEEISAYKNEADLWKLEKGIANSAGTLALHLTGNLNHFIGAVLGKSGYVRERDKEFSERNAPREKLIAGIDSAAKAVHETMSKLQDADLAGDFPIEFMGQRKTIQVLIILVAHLNYHLGQINYHRRLLAS